MSYVVDEQEDQWFHKIWNWDAPLKVKCFTWMLLSNPILTWDSLLKRGL